MIDEVEALLKDYQEKHETFRAAYTALYKKLAEIPGAASYMNRRWLDEDYGILDYCLLDGTSKVVEFCRERGIDIPSQWGCGHPGSPRDWEGYDPDCSECKKWDEDFGNHWRP